MDISRNAAAKRPWGSPAAIQCAPNPAQIRILAHNHHFFKLLCSFHPRNTCAASPQKMKRVRAPEQTEREERKKKKTRHAGPVHQVEEAVVKRGLFAGVDID
jgi:hypothetical protein